LGQPETPAVFGQSKEGSGKGGEGEIDRKLGASIFQNSGISRGEEGTKRWSAYRAGRKERKAKKRKELITHLEKFHFTNAHLLRRAFGLICMARRNNRGEAKRCKRKERNPSPKRVRNLGGKPFEVQKDLHNRPRMGKGGKGKPYEAVHTATKSVRNSPLNNPARRGQIESVSKKGRGGDDIFSSRK